MFNLTMLLVVQSLTALFLLPSFMACSKKSITIYTFSEYFHYRNYMKDFLNEKSQNCINFYNFITIFFCIYKNVINFILQIYK